MFRDRNASSSLKTCKTFAFSSLPSNRTVLIASLLSLFLSHGVQAEEKTKDDSKQPVEIFADQLISNEKQGTSRYQGSVKIVQGSFTLLGDNVKIMHPNNQLENIYAVGKPAKFKQFNPKENAWVQGEAKEIFYNAKLKTVKLSGSAVVEQDNKHQIKGENLVYDIDKQTLEGSGNQTQRIQVILQPNENAASEQGNQE